MKHLLPLALSALLASSLPAQTPTPPAAAPAKLESAVYAFAQLPVTTTATGVRRPVFDGPTTTVDQLHCHITTLNPGARSGEPRLHLQEEVIIVKEGTLEVNYDGKVSSAGPGSVIFFGARATTFLRNTGPTPATYTVIYYYTPLTPKS